MSTLKTNNIQHVDRSDPSIIISTDGGVSIAGTLTYEDVTSVDAVGIVTAREILNAQKQVHVGTGVSVKAGGINVTAGITTVQALQATTGTFSSTGEFSDNVSIVKAGGPVLELCNNTATTTMALRLHEGSAGSLVNGGGMTYDGASNKLHITCGTNLRTERITVDRDTGNVGVGLTSPEGLFHTRTSSGTNRNYIEASASHAFLRLKGGSTSYNSGLEFYSGSSNISNLTALGGGGFTFEVGGSERFRITSGGKLLVGHDAAQQVAGGDSLIQVQATDSTGRISVVQHRNEAEGAPYLSLGKTRGTSNGAVTVVQSGDTLGTIAFAGGDGTDIQTSAAHIVCQVDGTPGSNDMPGRLIFKTTADGASSTTERMRIDRFGVIRIGNTDSQATSGTKKRIAIGKRGSLMGYTSGHLNGHIQLIDNYYSDGSSNYIIEDGKASFLSLREGSFRFGNSSSSGTAGNVAPGINERVRIDSDGLSFNGDTAAANCLDDYEEGSWTATAEFGSGGYQSCANNVCRYVKVGSLVQVSGRFSLNNHTGSSGELRIGGLPFSKGNPAGDGNADGIVVYIEGAASNITNSISGLVLDSQTVFYVRRSGTTGSGNDVSGLTDSGTTLLVGGTYSTVA